MSFFICLTILLFNCKNTDQAYIQTIIQEWTNKKIIFPDDIQAKNSRTGYKLQLFIVKTD